MDDISDCGAEKEKWLSDWNIPEAERENAWKQKLALDAKIAAQGTMIQGNAGIMPDIQPYKSMIDGSMIDSRKKHRDHLKRHGCIEVGNEKVTPKTPEAPKGLKDTIGREVYRHLG
jgi:hypothetical protein